jgi:hypothetical protein
MVTGDPEIKRDNKRSGGKEHFPIFWSPVNSDIGG